MTDEIDIDPAPPRVTGSPESIWLVYGDIDSDAVHSECHEVMWCADSQYPADVNYVRADLFDAQAAEIERMRADAAAYQLLRRGQHWSIIDGIGQALRGEELDAAVKEKRND
jgi:hypothetical protein